MKERCFKIFLIVLLAVFLLSLFYLILKYFSNQNEKECFYDSDCASASCCHSTSVVSKKNSPDCSDIICTSVCAGPLDCGCGKPACIENKCKIKQMSNESWCQ